MNTIAIIVVIFSSFSAAYLIIRKEIRHCKSLDSVLRLITAVKNKATFYSAPFAEIIVQLQNNEDYYKIKLFDIFSDNLHSGMIVPDAWHNAIISSYTDMDENERDVLIRFGKEMCSCSRDEIAEIADHAISEINELRNAAIEKRNSKSKSTAAVTVSFGLMIVLIFV